MSPVLPIALVHRGRHLAAGVLLDDRLAGPGSARRRALALWEPGARAFEVDGAILLRFARPRELDAAEAPGHLVVEAEGCLLAAPLTPAERKALAPPPGRLVAIRAGAAVALALGPEVDPSAWLALEVVWIAIEPLGEPPPAPAAPAPPPAPDVRAALALGPAAPRAAAVRAALLAAQGSSGAAPARESLPALLGRALGRLGASLARGMAGLASSLAAALGASIAGAPAGLASPALPASPGRFSLALRRLWHRFLFLARIAHLAGARQGAYLSRLFRMFERGDLREALRHAIPLGGEGSAERLALGVPSARESLEIAPGAAAPGSSLLFGGELYSEMQRLYRRAFEQLDAQGRTDEAAFVLAELLRADAEAVSYLERQGRARLAAELAEARGLPAGLVVRQWFLAGDVERAVAVARARGAFADAIDRLERAQNAKEAQALALCWAEELAEAGDFEQAVEVARKVPSAAGLAQRWIELAVAAGGAAGCALLPAWLELAPERFAAARDLALAACREDGPAGPSLRAALARGMVRRGSGEGGRPELKSALETLARPVTRALLADCALGRAAGGDVEKVAALAADGALDADLPSRRRRPATRWPLSLDLDPSDRGTRPALDAAVLPSGRVLAALGEGGAALLAHDGRSIGRLDAPAHRLVVSELGTRALALAPRGEAVRISRLDLDARAARPARDLRIRVFSESYDGATWAAASDESVLVFDCLRDDLRTLWRVGDLGGAPVALARGAGELAFVVSGPSFEVEGWVYALPSLALRRRTQLPLASIDFHFPGAPIAYARGGWFALSRPRGEPAEGAVVLGRAEGAAAREVRLEGSPADLLQLAGGEVLAVALRTGSGVEVTAFDPSDLRPLAKVRLGGARSARVRTAGRTVTLSDDCGRVIGLDLAGGRVTHDVRL